MERATILGIYDFIGYSLCRHMLDLGFEIDGIHQSGNIDDYFTEEKTSRDRQECQLFRDQSARLGS